MRGETPKYLRDLLANTPEPGSEAGDALRAQLRGDLHSHSDLYTLLRERPDMPPIWLRISCDRGSSKSLMV